MDDEQGIVTTKVTIERRYYPDRDRYEDRETITVNTEGDPTLVELLGLIEFARIDASAPMVLADPYDDEDED